MTPRKGLTSEKSRPQANGNVILVCNQVVGRVEMDPTPFARRTIRRPQAWLASAPRKASSSREWTVRM